MSETKEQKAIKWVGRVMALLIAVGGAVTASGWLPPEVLRWTGLGVAVVGAVFGWCQRQLPTD